MCKYFIIAGEASGDLHGANLVEALKIKQPNASFIGLGGDKMQAAGMNLIGHYKDIAVMGFVKVLLKLRTLLRNMEFCKQEILKAKPDALILIDFPGFNLRMAEFAHKHNIKVLYYIAPKVWASRPKRVKKIKAYCDKVFCILPFEIDFFKQHGVEVSYIGNPLLDEVSNWKPALNEDAFRAKYQLGDKPIVALLSGSRKHEIKYNLPGMLEVAKQFPDHTFVIAGVPFLDKENYEVFLSQSDVKLVIDETYSILRYAKAAVVTSGTATLETCLFNVPQVVTFAFGGGRISYWALRSIVKVKYISLVNLMLDKQVVRELIQMDYTVETLKQELALLLNKTPRLKEMQDDYALIHAKMGKPGASESAAKQITHFMENN